MLLPFISLVYTYNYMHIIAVCCKFIVLCYLYFTQTHKSPPIMFAGQILQEPINIYCKMSTHITTKEVIPANIIMTYFYLSNIKYRRIL